MMILINFRKQCITNLCRHPFQSVRKKSQYLLDLKECIEIPKYSNQEQFSHDIKSNDKAQTFNALMHKAYAVASGQNMDTYPDNRIDRLDTYINEMMANELVSSLIALNLLNVPLYHPVNQKLSIRISHLLEG